MPDDNIDMPTNAKDRALLYAGLKVLGGVESAKGIYDFSAERLAAIRELRERVLQLPVAEA